MKDQELELLIANLETRSDLTVADYDGVLHALSFLLPAAVPENEVAAQQISTTDGALLVVDQAYPNWTVNIHGRANDRDGHWRCSLRESDTRDNDAAIGAGKSPVLAQAILASALRLTAILKRL